MEPSPTFRLTIAVGESDIDALGHASNIAYVRWIQDVAIAHSEAVGLDLTAYQRLGAVFVIVRHEVDYLRPSLRGDTLEARTWIPAVMAAKCHRATEIVRQASGSDSAPASPPAKDVVVAKALTTWGFIDVMSGRPKRIPEEIRAAFFAVTR